MQWRRIGLLGIHTSRHLWCFRRHVYKKGPAQLHLQPELAPSLSTLVALSECMPRRHACRAVPGAGRPPPFGVIRKPRRLDFGEDGMAAPRMKSAAADRDASAPAQSDALAPRRSGSQALPEQRSDSQSMLELEDLSAVPEDLRRQSESGSLPVSLKALQASLAQRPHLAAQRTRVGLGHRLCSCCTKHS